MKKTVMFLSSAIIFLLSSCEKTDQSIPDYTDGKWKVVNAITLNVDATGTASNATQYFGTASDYIDFRDNGKVYSSVKGKVDSTNYTLNLDNNTITFRSPFSSSTTATTYTITTLTSTVFQMNSKIQLPKSGSTEYTVNLKK